MVNSNDIIINVHWTAPKLRFFIILHLLSARCLLLVIDMFLLSAVLLFLNDDDCRTQNPPRLVLPVRNEGFQQGDAADSGRLPVGTEEVPAAGLGQLQLSQGGEG